MVLTESFYDCLFIFFVLIGRRACVHHCLFSNGEDDCAVNLISLTASTANGHIKRFTEGKFFSEELKLVMT